MRVTDPVCGMTIDSIGAEYRADFSGSAYHFCSAFCRKSFETAPERYVRAEQTGSVEVFTHEPRVAYFSMEIALREEIPTYSGGLGMLAGDTMRAAADLELPMVGLTLVSRAGYFRQQIVDDRQVEQPDWWRPEHSSGMKAAFNGVPHLTVLGGWWLEGWIEGVTGWSIGGESDDGRDAESLYDKLEQSVLPLYADRPGWIAIMKGAITHTASFFNTHRMVRRYAAEAYLH